VHTRKNAKNAKQAQVLNGEKDQAVIKRKCVVEKTILKACIHYFFSYCNACGLRYARQIAKQQNDDRPENAEV
jgi:hypothetical protein